ncbi:MAG TPA: D-2-hydroxyacid dehydrogenase [Candidatus Micrarchaeia archaeon]|nr:D-2-hydroxyacid dehydrogenase [Candidatus Micrarchaeia archaeon]
MSADVGAARWRAVITTPLEAELVAGLRRRHPGVEFVVPTALLAPARYPADHPFPTVADRPGVRAEWETLLDGADILFDFGPTELQPTLARRPRLRWIQATSAGVGPLVQRIGLAGAEGPVVTTASGVHAGPLAEFAVLGMLWLIKDGPRLLRQQRAHLWERTATAELAGRTVLVVGMGRIGAAVAQDCRALGMRVVGCARRPRAGAADLPVDELILPSELDHHLPGADVVVLSCPLTPATHHLLDGPRLGRLRPTAILVNVGRGACVDEGALVAALQAGRLAGAALDVAEEEPLPPHSPLWDLPQVLISPHSASTVADENQRIVAIFDDNLGRFQRGEPLRNGLDKGAGY